LIADDAGNLTAPIILCNTICSADQQLMLSLTDLTKTDDPAAPGLGATISITPNVGMPPKAPTCSSYTLTVGKVWEAGDYSTSLKNDTEELTKIRVARYRVPFGLTVPNPPARSFEGKVRIPVVNPDREGYRLNWNLQVGGKSCSPDTQNSLLVPALSTIPFNCTVSRDGFLSSMWLRSGTVKDETVNAILTLKSAQLTGQKQLPAGPVKEFPLTLTMSYYDENTQAVVNVLSLLVFLIIGGCISLLMAAGLPNMLRRLKIKQRLRAVKEKNSGLPPQMDPALGVALSVERRRVSELAGQQYWFSPDALDGLTSAESALTALERKADFVSRIKPSLRLVHSPRGGGLPPTLLQSIDLKCHDAVRLLRKDPLADTDIAELNTILNDIAKSSADADQSNLMQDILQREASLRHAIFGIPLPAPAPIAGLVLAPVNLIPPAAPAVNPAPTLDPKFQAAFDAWSEPFNALLAVPIDQIDPAECLVRDTVAVKLTLLMEAVRANADIKGVIAELKLTDWRTITRVRQMVQRLLEQVTVDEVETEILNQGFSILLSHEPDALDAITMGLYSENAAINRASARSEFLPVWSFGHGKFLEVGWEVRHFFPSKVTERTYIVDVYFRKSNVALEKAPGQEFHLSKGLKIPGEPRHSPGKRFWLELTRSSLLMVIGALLLQKTAQSALANTNIWSGILGVIATGFAIDTLKSAADTLRSRP
jgi:hypothetical protein